MGIFIPPTRVHAAMQAAESSVGFWPTLVGGHDGCVFFVKAPTGVIRAAANGCEMTLHVAAATTEIGEVLATAFSIEDTLRVPRIVCGARRVKEERLALLQAIQGRQATITFYDEIARCIASAHCSLDVESANSAYAFLHTHPDWYEGNWNSTLCGVRDEVLRTLDPSIACSTSYTPRVFPIALTLSDIEFNESIAVGETERVDCDVANSPTGLSLEQGAWQLLEGVFGMQIYHSPNYPDGTKGSKEHTDILAKSEIGLCHFDTKAEGISGTGRPKTLSRKNSKVQGDVDDAVDQLTGAMRRIRKGVQLSSSHNDAPIAIELKPYSLWHAVVVVSEMTSGPDWKKIAAKLREVSEQEAAMIQVMDLQELVTLASVSPTPVGFMTRLTNRYQQMVVAENAFIRSRPPASTVEGVTEDAPPVEKQRIAIRH